MRTLDRLWWKQWKQRRHHTHAECSHTRTTGQCTLANAEHITHIVACAIDYAITQSSIFTHNYTHTSPYRHHLLQHRGRLRQPRARLLRLGGQRFCHAVQRAQCASRL